MQLRALLGRTCNETGADICSLRALQAEAEAADGSQEAPVPADAMDDDDDEPMITGEMDLDQSLAVRCLSLTM